MNTTEMLEIPRWLVVLILLVCLVGIVDRDLWTPDEPRDAAVALAMARNGNYVVPHLSGEPFIEKPPLYFAVGGVVARWVGPVVGDVGAIRLSTALWGLGVLWMTFLLGRRLADRTTGLLAVALLATMVGFVENMHWIRVDAALAFFVVAAVWCLAEWFRGNRPGFALPAGLFAAGAFLSKGVIGPLFIGIGWFALALPRWMEDWRARRRLSLFVGPHLAAVAGFVVVSGLWVVLLRKVGGEELWNEWFWQNHVGRMAGTTTQLGHLHPGEPWYYLQTLALYSVPWLPLLLYGLWRFGREVRGALKSGWMSLAALPGVPLVLWGFGALAMLSISVTKRDIYLLPAFPAYALLCALVLRRELPRWIHGFYRFWMWLCALALLVLAVLPLWSRWLPAKAIEEWPPITLQYDSRYMLVLLALLLTVYFARARERYPAAVRWIAVTALLLIAAWAVPGEAVDQAKSMGPAYRAFALQIPVERRARVAAWDFTETTRGGLDFYAGASFRRIHDPERLEAILKGRDPEFDSVIIDRNKNLDALLKAPYRILAEGHPGAKNRKRPLYWVEGTQK